MIESEHTHVGSKQDEDSDIPLRPRSRRTMVVIVEEVSRGVVEG